jgi:hypothetical protein
MSLFSKEANETIAQAFAWLEQRKLYQAEPIIQYPRYRDGMAFSSEEQRILRSMAESSGWIWARGFGYDKPEIKAIVEKAINGERLGSKQRLLMQSMLEVMAEAKATVIPF